MLSSGYLEVVTLWKLQSLLSVFKAWRNSSSVSIPEVVGTSSQVYGGQRFNFEVSQKVLVIFLRLLHSRCTPRFVERLRETRSSPIPRAYRGFFVPVGQPKSFRSCKKTRQSPGSFSSLTGHKKVFWPIRSRQFKRFWNWFGKSKCPGACLDLTVNFHHEHFIDPTNCPWVSEDVVHWDWRLIVVNKGRRLPGEYLTISHRRRLIVLV